MMSDTEADDCDLIRVEIIREESAVITVKIPKGHCGPLPDIFQDPALGGQIFDALKPLKWICNDLRMGLYWETHRPGAHVFDARPMIQKAGGVIPKSVSGSSEPEE
jgi:hypothetical protein